MCAGFVAGASVDPTVYPARKSLAWRCGALAWVGVGIHDLAIPYIVPYLQLALHTATQPAGSGGAGMEQVELIGFGAFLVLLFGLFVTGLGLAAVTGLGGEALHARLRRLPLAVA